MAMTRQQLVYRALYNLGVLPHGQNPGAEEYDAVDELVDPMIEELISRDLVFIEDVDAIEDRFFLALGDVLAGKAASIFGMQNDPAMAARMTNAEMILDQMDMNDVRYSRTMPVMRSDYPTVNTLLDASTLFST